MRLRQNEFRQSFTAPLIPLLDHVILKAKKRISRFFPQWDISHRLPGNLFTTVTSSTVLTIPQHLSSPHRRRITIFAIFLFIPQNSDHSRYKCHKPKNSSTSLLVSQNGDHNRYKCHKTGTTSNFVLPHKRRITISTTFRFILQNGTTAVTSVTNFTISQLPALARKRRVTTVTTITTIPASPAFPGPHVSTHPATSSRAEVWPEKTLCR